MLHENKFYPASDLWALGCIIYQMRVGVTPFMGSVDYEVFQKITERQIVIPNELEPEIVDLIDRLLQLNPEDRLGAGPPGSKNSYEALKSHPYFRSVNFNTLETTYPPLPQDRYQTYFETLKKKIKVEDETLKLMGKPSADFGANSSEDSIKSEVKEIKVIL
jgi:serine/threonine protein kinase